MSPWSVTEMVSGVPRPLELGSGRVLLSTHGPGEFVGAYPFILSTRVLECQMPFVSKRLV